MEFSSDSEGGPKMGPAGEQTEEEKEAIEAYMAYIENERGMIHIRFMMTVFNLEIKSFRQRHFMTNRTFSKR